MNIPPPSAPAGPDAPDPGATAFRHHLDPKRLFEAAAMPTERITGAPPATAPPIDEVAAAFPLLEILELLGAGGMGAVFKARQPALDRFVALKILPATLLAADPAFAERFAREGRLLARLNHPNIVAVHDFGRSGPFFYLLMEYVDGVSLRQAMRGNRFTPDEALALVPRICEALQFAHDEGVLHRDIKPENILLDARGRVKLADFGIAKLAGSREPAASYRTFAEPGLTQAGAALGTPSYMAPEQREHPGAVDHRADIYSLGVVFYELLTGGLPVGQFPPPSATAAVDARIDMIVERALERDRALRQQSAREMKTEVEAVTLGPPPPPPQPPVAPPPPSAAAGAAKAGAVAAAEAPRQRWSGTSIASAILTGLSLLPAAAVLMAAFFIAVPAPRDPGGSHPSEFPLFAPVLLVLIPVLLTALPGTLLGWIGLRDLRVARGSKRGRGLALFGALTWPLLLTGAATAFAMARLTFAVAPKSWVMVPGLVLWLTLFVGICCFAVSQTRKWVNTGAAAGAVSSSSRGCLIALAATAAALAPIVVVVVYFLRSRVAVSSSVEPAPAGFHLDGTSPPQMSNERPQPAPAPRPF